MNAATPYRVLSSDSHIVEPPDMYSTRVDKRFRDRAPKIERRETPAGVKFDAWYVEGKQVATLGGVIQAGKRFEDPTQIDFLGVWEDVRKAAYEPAAMIQGLEEDGIWGACLQASQGLFWYRLPDTDLLTELSRVYNDWIAEFCRPYPDRLKGIGMINVDDVDIGCRELERCAKLGLVGAFIPVAPLADRPYRDPRYEKLWATAAALKMPLLLHIATPRGGIPGCEFTLMVSDLSASARCTTDYWARYSMTAMIFAGVFDRHPGLKIGSVEHEMAWIPHWIKQMDLVYTERPVFTRGWKSTEGMLPSDYWRRNFFVQFMEDDIGVKMRDFIGVETMMWGNDFPHAESTWPRSMAFLDRMFEGVTADERKRMTSDNAAAMFGFPLK